MTKQDWPSRDDPAPERSGRGAIASPFVAQGLRDALRNAYARPCDANPADLLTLLDRLH